MIPKANRLPSHTKLLFPIFQTTPFFSVKIASNNLSYNRYAFVVGKSVDKSAVVRNRLRRVLREIVVATVVDDGKGKDMLFVVRKNFIKIPREELLQVVEKALSSF